MNDQSTTCPKCGARTNFYTILSFVSNENVEIYKCFSDNCQFVFVVEVEIDDDFLK